MTIISCDSSSPKLIASDSGYRDFSFSASGVNLYENDHGPTGEKPQSKLWISDGIWWGVLFDRSTEEYRIYRYDEATHTWSDTGAVVDERNSSRSDALWDGTHLYVASAGPQSTIGSDSARVLRYSYDAATKSYSLDAGFPVTVSNGGMEAIVLAKDTTGKLWVTYTQNGQVYVNHTLGDDSSWATPFVLPVQGTTADSDDISSTVAFGSQVGVMWSNQANSAFYFATHTDGAPPDAWQASAAVQGPGVVNDHINLKADSSGRVFAAVKTTRDRVNPNSNAAYNVLLVRDQEGNWTTHTFGRVTDRHTRPIVLLDEEHRYLYMFAASCCSGGSIYYKRTDLDNISFEGEGRGVPFIESTTDLNINDATSTKQNLNGDTGLLVLASDGASGYYLHNEIDLNAVDATPPAIRPPAESLHENSELDTSTVLVRLDWSATDGESDIMEYHLQQSTDGGAYAKVSLPATATGSTRFLAPGNAYRFRMRATDATGNWSEWAYGPQFFVEVHQETSERISYAGTWKQQALMSSAYGGGTTYAEAAGAEVGFTFAGRDIAWVAARGPNRGTAEVWLDGVKVETVSLYSPTEKPRRMVFSKGWATSDIHTIKVRVLGTKSSASGGTRVDVDAFVVLR